ncbi:hypothetical protein [Primorskyibacter flagellatus]|uniref:Tetratricopeptide repeat protein n=1 Tax=Primorskyibacter flagellatus TaxID=1387277 RepID=A0A1W2EEJ2_9RHOB|nr:hypothetical protein [Primorskyibacter flagellatus]SMD08095.1 hypothetical protein SAMN06295998_12727 [Primorskyibacter flagellatus]
MTTNTFGRRIWGFDRSDAEMKMARAAGWSRADLVWERLLEAGNLAWAEGVQAKAASRFRQADLLTRLCFDRNDLRRATCHANLSLIAMAGNKPHRAALHQARALQIWKTAASQIATMNVAPRSRSSLFHLRLEAKHRDTFHDNMRKRFSNFAAETEETLRMLTAPAPSRHRHFSRWRGERPNVYDDTRKIMGACLLIIDRA